jgi:membrane associated rhomboid family serine protease
MSSLPDLPLTEVGRYARFSEAQERGLVAAAQDQAYWVVREGADFRLYVETAVAPRIAEELARFEEERAERKAELKRSRRPLPKIETFSLFAAACVISLFWAWQNVDPRLLQSGPSFNLRILHHGEWWRAVTALTLHSDLSHLAANIATGLLFGAFVVPQLGGGVAWLAIVVGGALGNVANALFYRSEMHGSIGASTAVFAALGLLVGSAFIERWRHPAARTWWQLVVPIGAGLGLLAFLGAGDGNGMDRVDYMAHFFGFCAGIPLGAAANALRLRDRVSRTGQLMAGWSVLGIFALAWWLALRP